MLKFTNSSNVAPKFPDPKIGLRFLSATHGLPDKGNLAYEYNPFRNFRMQYDSFKSDGLGRLINGDNPITFEYLDNGVLKVEVLTVNNIYSYIKDNLFLKLNPNAPDLSKAVDSDHITKLLMETTNIADATHPSWTPLNLEIVARAGSIIDLETNLLKFSLNHPVQIECQESYDGSVNLILNDDYSEPKLINSRFIKLELNTYKVANRRDNNDTNIYDDHSFDIDSSLYKRITSIPHLKFDGLLNGGDVTSGNYTFYFKYSDADGNETDFVTESGQVVCHVGNLNSPKSTRGGILNESSNKMIRFNIGNIDSSYDFVTVYYTRKYSDVDGVPVTEVKKLDKLYRVEKQGSDIVITGFEPTIDLTIDDINVQYNVVNSAKTQAQAQSMLFMGNVHKPEIPYRNLTDLALRIYPTPFLEENIGFVDNRYHDASGRYEYYNVNNIYEKLSYWDKEIYRFGVVFILTDYTLSPVFNIRGRDNCPIPKDGEFPYTAFAVYGGTNTRTGEMERKYIDIASDGSGIANSTNELENAKGVVRFNIDDQDKYMIDGANTTPLGIRFFIDNEVIDELTKLGIKGYFIVRQRRIPTILCQALTVALDRNAYVPLIPTTGGEYITERFVNDELVLDNYFRNHVYSQKDTDVEFKAALCPEAELRQELFNQLFTGSEFVVQESKFQPRLSHFSQDGLLEGRSFYIGDYKVTSGPNSDYYDNIKVTSVQDDLSIITSGTQFFSARAGNASEAWRYSWLKRNSKWKPSFNGGSVLSQAIDMLSGLFGRDREKAPEPVKPNNMIRGSWGTYVGLENFNIPMRMLNIYIPGYNINRMNEYFQVRYDDVSPYYPIMHRSDLTKSELFTTITHDVDGNKLNVTYSKFDKYGGDCYACTFTHRMQRNFEDPEININDEIIDENTFKDNFEPNNMETNQKINRADVNAVQIGHWVTFKLLSNVNLGLRDIDRSKPTETALFGVPRGFFPLYGKSYSGNYKLPESQVLNGGISSTNGEKYYYSLPDVPYIKQEFDNTIMYSDVHINDAFKNGYRIFKSTAFHDYTREYGSITKLVSWYGNIVCVFEHGIALIPINERVNSGEGPGGTVYINTDQVLPENPRVISNMLGTQWIDSVIATDNFIYGVDTVAKKIWKTDGQQIEIISDFKIQKFLNDYITFDEREFTPILGVRNVKSHYNAFKKDIMFTLYDDTFGLEENVWHICWNELMNRWITFYSWVPSASENIDNIYFSFDRNTTKWIAKLGKSNYESTYSEGICLDNVIFEENPKNAPNITTVDWVDGPPSLGSRYVGELKIKERNLPNVAGKISSAVKYTLLEDPFRSHEGFELKRYMVTYTDPNDATNTVKEPSGAYLYATKNFDDYIYSTDLEGNPSTEWMKRVYQLNIEAEVKTIIWNNTDRSIRQFDQGFKTYAELNGGFFTNSIAVAPLENIAKWQSAEFIDENGNRVGPYLSDSKEFWERSNDPDWKIDPEHSKWYPGLTTDFWKHGQAGLIDIADEIMPTKWYGKVHPFEFEFVVTDNVSVQKIFNNLYLISNKAEPESFHFEVVGESYNFAEDKKNVYYRQELTKEFFQNAMSKDIMYDRKFRKIKNLIKQAKSYFFPLYYNRIDTFDEIYDIYQKITSAGKDYQNLTGTEIVWDKQLNEFRLVSHQKGMDLKKYGRLRGNMHYKEDIWNVEIRPINYVMKNEDEGNPLIEWIKKIPIIASMFPHQKGDNPGTTIPTTPYDGHRVTTLDNDGWSKRSETRVRDKYIKIKVRYSGHDLAIISALKTIFTPSYA